MKKIRDVPVYRKRYNCRFQKERMNPTLLSAILGCCCVFVCFLSSGRSCGGILLVVFVGPVVVSYSYMYVAVVASCRASRPRLISDVRKRRKGLFFIPAANSASPGPGKMAQQCGRHTPRRGASASKEEAINNEIRHWTDRKQRKSSLCFWDRQ